MQFEVRPFRPGDEEALLAFHNRAFSGCAPRSRRHWEWKFRENPLGATEIVLATTPAGTTEAPVCVAVYAVVPLRCSLQGEPCVGGLQTDLAVDPSLRTGLGGSRLIVSIGRAYRDHFLQGKKLEWAFPEPQLQRVCMAHLQVGVLRDVTFLVREPGPAPAGSNGLSVEPMERFDGEADALWSRCQDQHGVAVVRDARYLNWRYADHPDVPYLALAAREPAGGKLRGIAVARSGGVDERLFSFMDWIVPDDDRDAEAALLRGLMDAAREREKPYVAAWFPLSLPRTQRWQREFGFFARGTPFQESYRSWAKGLGRRWLDEHWYQTMGDIDFL